MQYEYKKKRKKRKKKKKEKKERKKKSNSFHINDYSSPNEYTYYDYKVFLILRDFLQPKSTISLSDVVDRVIDLSSDGGVEPVRYQLALL
jgi:ribosomal protein S18